MPPMIVVVFVSIRCRDAILRVSRLSLFGYDMALRYKSFKNLFSKSTKNLLPAIIFRF